MPTDGSACAFALPRSPCSRSSPGAVTSRGLVTTTVLEWHRAQANGDGEAGCRLLTDDSQDAAVESDRSIMRAAGIEPAETCVEAVDRFGTFAGSFRAMMLSTQVDAVNVRGDRATATVHTRVTIRGTTRDTPPAQIPLRWVGGRWLID